jgi:D-hydroxyproline dehydrogenase subunit beta
MQHFDVAVVGGGIVGLAHAWCAARQGLRVALFERTPRAVGASIRNFGMVWPIGQPLGAPFQLALRSRELWLELTEEAGIWLSRCGSLHVAHREDELAVLEEFVPHARAAGADVAILSPTEALKRSPGIRPDGLLGAMWSPYEAGVNPPATIAAIPGYLTSRYDVQCHFNTQVVAVEERRLTSSDGREWLAERIVVCSGHDFQTLLPDAFAHSGIRICKLHMLRTVPQANGLRLGPHLASGLTLRHYTSFQCCPSLARLKARVQAETPELDRYGIHVMASQNELGEVILGDSHEYDDDISPFDNQQIDEWILRELKKQFVLPDWQLQARWHGIYAKHPGCSMVELEPHPQLHICVAPGGAGMTLSFGYADRFWTGLPAPAGTS